MTWTLDKAHAEVGFSVRHLMVSKVHGVFRDFDATVEIDEAQPERSSVVATVAVASVDTKAEDRDTHLRSPDFFDAEHYPELRFESRSVEKLRNGSFEVVGDLTIRDVTREIRLKGEVEGPQTDPWGNRHAGLTLEGEIDREDFGLGWNMALEAGGVLVGRQVKLSIEAEIMEAAAVVGATEAAAAAS